MKLFQCQACGNPLYFENVSCLACGHDVGFLPEPGRMAAIAPEGSAWRLVPGPGEGLPQEALWRYCRNWEVSACNWMVPAIEGSSGFCPACSHNRTIPDLSDPENHLRWQKIEAAKRRLFYTLMRLGLPRPAPGGGQPEPLVFDFLAEDPGSAERVMTGHAEGVVTIALTEADDAAREAMKSSMGEAYRTLLGHFRHEVGHYYWDLLVRDGGNLDSFRALFGDEREDYGAALARHYQDGAPPDWQAGYVSPYATMHPWEDWAETWAHYLHMIETLETAYSLRVEIEPVAGANPQPETDVDFDPYLTPSVERLIGAWIPLTIALNMLNRSMGLSDFYPFALSEPVAGKLGYVHDLVRRSRAAT